MKFKIKNFKKFVRSIIIVFLILLGISFIISRASFSYKDIEYKSIYVSNGDTLWNISENLQKTNAYYKGKDIRDIVSNLKKVNNLKTSNLSINQELKIIVL